MRRVGGDFQEFCVLLGVGLFGLPERQVVALVPDFKLVYPPLEMPCERADIVFPRLQTFFPVIERDVPDAGGVGEIVHVKRIAVSDVKPGLNPPRAQVVYDGVEPREIVFALLRFSARPAGLAPGEFQPGLRDFVVDLFGVEDFSVEALEAYPEPVCAAFLGVYPFDAPDFFQVCRALGERFAYLGVGGQGGRQRDGREFVDFHFVLFR